MHHNIMTFYHVLRNAIILCKRVGLIFNWVEPGRALMKFIADLSDACTASSKLNQSMLLINKMEFLR